MASYASVLSAMNTLNQIKRHPRPPISINQNQMDSLDQNLSFMLNFLEHYSGEEDEELESRITAAAYATEDAIETHIVHRIHSGSNVNTADSSQGMDLISIIDLYQGLERAIQDMELIKKEVSIKAKMGGREDGRPLRRRPASTRQSSSTIFEFDDALINKVMDKLIAKESFKVIPIVGMGGIGKTSLAQKIYKNSLIDDHFDILVWVTISQEYSASEILSKVLSEEKEGMSESELGVKVHKKLCGRRYLIVMDDIWSIEAWDQVKNFFPNNNNGSRVMITTRLSKLATDISGSQDFQMNFLDEEKSWALFCQTVFGKKEDCPIELEGIAKKVVRNCRGLPLSIAVIEGVLKSSDMTPTYWESILENLSSSINLEDNEYCLGLLHTSYKELPIHLKSCFLYMGIFREDDEIRVSELVKLWVAEGIIRPSEEKELEEIAVVYIMELVERNLISVHKFRWNGEVKLCKMHDLLRDLCLREGKTQRFLCAIKYTGDLKIPQYMNMDRRICIDDNSRDYSITYFQFRESAYREENSIPFFHALETATLARSFILQWGWFDNFAPLNYRLLRVLKVAYRSGYSSCIESCFQNINLRYLTIKVHVHQLCKFPSWILFWNLQTIKVHSHVHMLITAPVEIWEMVLLRHVIIKTFCKLPYPPGGENGIQLKHLQTLSKIDNFECSNAVIKRIPNVRILKICYRIHRFVTEYDKFCVNNFYHLKNLQSLNIMLLVNEEFVKKFGQYMAQNLNFPHSLKKLTLRGNLFEWEECRTKIGLLPSLEYLKLDWYTNSFVPEWKTVEGQFPKLKFLHLLRCYGLRYWNTDDTHFPRLEHLFLQGLELEEIPSSIGYIDTLKSIHLEYCSKSVKDSARRIKEEQIHLGNEDLQLIIIESKYAKDMEKESEKTDSEEELSVEEEEKMVEGEEEEELSVEEEDEMVEEEEDDEMMELEEDRL